MFHQEPVEAEGGFKNVVTCNCSICQRKGSMLAFVPEENFKLISGGAKMKAVNVRCLENVDLKNLNIREFDGKSL